MQDRKQTCMKEVRLDELASHNKLDDKQARLS